MIRTRAGCWENKRTSRWDRSEVFHPCENSGLNEKRGAVHSFGLCFFFFCFGGSGGRSTDSIFFRDDSTH